MKKNFNLNYDNKGIKTSEKKKSIDIKSLMKLDFKTLKKKLSKIFKKSNKLNTPDKKRKVIAFDMGSTTIKIVEAMYYKNQLTIYKYIKVPTPKDGIIDGEIKKEEELCSKLKRALKKNNFNGKYGVCTTNSTLIINREIQIPKVEDEEIETVIRYEIQQYLPINLDEHMIQYNILSEKVVDGKQKLEVLIVVYPNRMIYSYAELTNLLGGKPYALDLNYNSKRKALYIMNPEMKETVLSMDIGSSNIGLTIINNNELVLIKAINSGGNYLDGQIAKLLGISLEEAENEKKENCNLMSREEGPLEHSVKEVVDMWFDEASRFMKYYKSKNSQSKIDKIYICGGGANIKGLERYVSSKFDMRVKILQGNSNIEFKKNVEEVSISEYINAIGALIRL